MFFQLMVGTHREIDGKVYTAKVLQRGQQGRPVKVFQPVLISNANLDKKFGGNKFRAITEVEYKRLLKLQGASENPPINKQTSEAPSPETETSAIVDEEIEDDDFSKAAKIGAKDIAKPVGKDVTEKFPEAVKYSMKVYSQPGGKYFIVDSKGEMLTTENPIAKNEINEFIESYQDKLGE